MAAFIAIYADHQGCNVGMGSVMTGIIPCRRAGLEL